MQVLDLRYYDECISDAEISDMSINVSCHDACTGCWGPGNYSCNQFITVVDPHEAVTLDN